MDMHLYHKLLLLALHNRKGSVLISASGALPFALAGATLIELLEQNYIYIHDKYIGLNKEVNPTNKIFQQAVEIMFRKKNELLIEKAIHKLVNKSSRLQKNVITELVEMGILKKEDKKFLFWTLHRYPEQNQMPEMDILHHFKNKIRNNTTFETKELALIGLSKTCDMLHILFEKQERKTAKDIYKQWIKSNKNDTGKILSLVQKTRDNAAAAAIAVTTVCS